MTNTIISLALAVAIATTLGGQIASATYRASAVRTIAAPHVPANRAS
jgi:hypothetical protein